MRPDPSAISRLGSRALLGLCLTACVDRNTSDSATADVTTDAATTAPGPGTDPTPTEATTSATTATTTGDATTPGTTTPGTTTAASTTTADDTGTTGEPDQCPPDAPAFFDFWLDPAPSEFNDVTLDWQCEVVEVAADAEQIGIGLSCTDGMMAVVPPPTLFIKASPMPGPLALPPGDVVHLHFEQIVPWWSEAAIRVEAMDKTLLIAATMTEGSLDPFAGVEISDAASICPPEDDDFCGAVQHDALRLELDGAAAEVQSRHFTTLGTYGVWAQDLSHPLRFNCTDTPSAWRQLGLLRLGA